jgi:hypothetical protein
MASAESQLLGFATDADLDAYLMRMIIEKVRGTPMEELLQRYARELESGELSKDVEVEFGKLQRSVMVNVLSDRAAEIAEGIGKEGKGKGKKEK